MSQFIRADVKRVAVTGGTGFVGRRLIDRLLSEGYAVRAMSRRQSVSMPSQVELFNGDLLDHKTDLAGFLSEVDVLYHCAAEIRDESTMQALNTDSVSHLIKAASENKIHWIQLSSVGVYGIQKSGAITEDSPVIPVNVYERTKARADDLLMAIPDDLLLTWSILRPSNIYGEGMRAQGLRRMVDAVKRGIFFPIGDGKATVHYIHIDNVIDALLLCLEDKRATGRVYNLSDTNSLIDCVGIIAKFYGKQLKTFLIPEWLARLVVGLFSIAPGFPLNNSTIDVLTSRADYRRSRIENELGYHLRVPLDKGLNQYLIWMESERAQA